MTKKKIITTVILLIVCLALLIYSSYAWLVISRAPSITGIDTQIGANGNLEIALLSDATYMDTSKIKTKVGSAATVEDRVISNLTWGNLIDLTDESYGLQQIFMYPSRLNLSVGGANQGVLSGNMLTIPQFTADGRINSFQSNTVSAIYEKDAFTYYTESQKYGVRGIGTISNMTPQQSALTGARSLVRSYNAAALNATESAFRANGAKLLKLYIEHYTENKSEYSKSDVAVIRDTATRMLNAVSYMDLAMRQGIVGFGASVIDDANTFKTFKTNIENPIISLSMIVNNIPATLPKGFGEWIRIVEADKKALQQVILFCDNLKGESFTWDEIHPQLFKFIEPDLAYINDKAISDLDEAFTLSADNKLAIAQKSGIMANVADFNGNYDVIFEYGVDEHIQVITVTPVKAPYLKEVSNVLDNLKIDSGGHVAETVNLKDLYGFAVDLAFRCNTDTKLLLQTLAAERVDGNGKNPQTMGSGSFMKFSSKSLEKDQILFLMDAMRIGLVDNKNNLLAIAKLNTSNYTLEDKEYKAPIYLYEYSVSVDGSMSIGQRRDKDTVITNLSEDVPTIITAVVWLDGDHVDNSTVAQDMDSMTGSINLQFATDIELLAADILVGNK